MLPKKDGLAVIKEFGNQVPVLMLTARGTTKDIVTGLEAGADDYLPKPFALAELLSRVRKLLRRSERDRGAEILFSDLRLDPVSHKAWRSGNEIGLTSKEYGLLELDSIASGTVMQHHQTTSEGVIVSHLHLKPQPPFNQNYIG